MAASLRAAATRILRPAVLPGEGLRLLAPLSYAEDYLVLVGALPVTQDSFPDLGCSPRLTLGNILGDAARKMFSSGLPRILPFDQHTKSRHMNLLGASSVMIGTYAFLQDSSADSYVCFSESDGDEKIKELEEELKSLKDKNQELEVENKELKRGEEVEKAKIRTKLLLGYQLIKVKYSKEAGGQGEGKPPKKSHEWLFWAWNIPSSFKCWISRHRENVNGWTCAAVIVALLPLLTLDEMQTAVKQIIAGEHYKVMDRVAELLGAKVTLLPPPGSCPCGSKLPPVCSSCGRPLPPFAE